MSNKVKDINIKKRTYYFFNDRNIKNRTYYFFNDIINIENFDLNNIKIDKKS